MKRRNGHVCTVGQQLDIFANFVKSDSAPTLALALISPIVEPVNFPKEYQPEKWWTIGGSKESKRRGKALELLMFDEPSFLSWHLRLLNERVEKSNGKPNAYHRHLKWLLAKGENRQPKMLCPICGEERVVWFSVLGSFRFGISVGTSYTCCDDPNCKKKLQAGGYEKTPIFYPFQFSVLKNFSNKTDQGQIVVLFKHVFELPVRSGVNKRKHLSRKEAFDFFNAPP